MQKTTLMVRWGGPADIPNYGEKNNGDDVDGAGQLPQPVVRVYHWDVALHLLMLVIIIVIIIIILIVIIIIIFDMVPTVTDTVDQIDPLREACISGSNQGKMWGWTHTYNRYKKYKKYKTRTKEICWKNPHLNSSYIFSLAMARFCFVGLQRTKQSKFMFGFLYSDIWYCLCSWNCPELLAFFKTNQVDGTSSRQGVVLFSYLWY